MGRGQAIPLVGNLKRFTLSYMNAKVVAFTGKASATPQ
jgi:hypothetical protein